METPPVRLPPSLLTVERETRAAAVSPISGGGGGTLAAALAPLEEELSNKSMCPTPQGWILVLDRDAADGAATTYLLDTHSRRRVPLPPLGIDPWLIPYCSCLLLPQQSGRLVLLVEPKATILWYCRAGEATGGSEWTKYEYDIGTQGDEYFIEKTVIAPIAACGGRLYFNSTLAETDVLDLHAAAAPAFSSFATEEEEEADEDSAKVLLVESGGELYRVMLLYRDKAYDEAKVHRMDFSSGGRRRWRLVGGLGGRAFFVAQLNFGASCSCAAAGGASGIQEDCVYSLIGVPRNTFRVFNLREGTSQVRRLEQSPLLDTVQRSVPSWVVSIDPIA